MERRRRTRLQGVRDACAIAFSEYATNFDGKSKPQLIEWLEENAGQWERAINLDEEKSRLKTKLSDRFAQMLREM